MGCRSSFAETTVISFLRPPHGTARCFSWCGPWTRVPSQKLRRGVTGAALPMLQAAGFSGFSGHMSICSHFFKLHVAGFICGLVALHQLWLLRCTDRGGRCSCASPQTGSMTMLNSRKNSGKRHLASCWRNEGDQALPWTVKTRSRARATASCLVHFGAPGPFVDWAGSGT